jgi:hypothetical protein
MKNKVWLITIIGIALMAMVTSCGEDDPVTCNCPNGTLHLAGEPCCAGEGCHCEKNVAGQRVNGVAVTNRDNVANFSAMVGYYEEALSWMTDNQRAYIKDNLKEVKVVAGNAAITLPSNGIFTITNAAIGGDIWQALDDWCTANSID